MAAAARFFALLICFFGTSAVVAAANLSYQGIPSCAVNCILQEIGHSDCAITNQTCICHDDVLAGYVQTCVQASCTVREMLAARNQSLAACGVPVSEHDETVRWFRPTIFALPTFFLFVRVVNKYMKLSSWGWDDTTIMIAYAFIVAFLPAAYIAERTGAGRDIWTLTPEQITEFLFVFLIFSTLYMTSLAFIKSSILFLYLRIFPDENFRRVLWGTQLFNLLIWITFVTGTFAACQPLNFFWNGWKREMTGKCFNLNAFAMCHGVLNVALDAWMLVLPATQIYGLRMKLKTKVGVMLMFGVGIFLTAVSAYRIKTLLSFATSYNITADSFQGSVWSSVELCVGAFVACLPSTRQVWRVLFPKILEVTHISTRSSPSSKGSNAISQASRTLSGAHDQPRMASYEESSIAHLVGDFNKIDLNNLPDTSSTEATHPRTPKNRIETKGEPGSGSSRGS
ncbi:Putative extracellular membrane protein, CFEM [Colletotrichum destructivum]|uniref:Extracellular membrane protein, CFEM n=1 Tax=Colletotrichum destructivum TaxID=34406 RepID=A0AAX4HWH5_9PEZI|nr:Putative extracellular membrane protein, CFEM [Colletotrichum destructivum]